jgi:hypothetical protein
VHAIADDPRSDPESYYQLSTEWQGFCGSLDVVNDAAKNRLRLAPTGLFSGQHWRVNPVRDGYYVLTTEWQGKTKRLDIANDGRNDTPVLAPAGDYSGQYWRIEPSQSKPGYFTLSTEWQGPGKRLDIANDGRNDKPRLAPAGNFSGQNWLFTRVARVGPVPASLGTYPFYKKYLDAGGIPIISSQNVSDAALYRARYLILQMLAGQDAVRAAMARNGARLAIIGATEPTTAIPENEILQNHAEFEGWDGRARGLGGTMQYPVGSGAEENILCQSGDRYDGEDILIHEFAHSIHNLGLAPTYSDFQSKLDAAFANAKSVKRWSDAGPNGMGDTYALKDAWEYFAEGVQSWFNVNQQPDASHNQVDTRAELETYDPELYALIASYFPADVRACSCYAH